MAKKFNVIVLGDGRIAQGAAHFFRRCPATGRVDMVSAGGAEYIGDAHLVVGALPAHFGERGLDLALRHRLPLVDISDLDPEFYLRRRKAIDRAGITVIPGCGFCPGLLNFILGREAAVLESPVRDVEVEAGSLSARPYFFPFLWCFEDLVQEHRLKSSQIVNGRKIVFPPFAGYREERHAGIDAESYYCASGFENILDRMKIRNLQCRVIRPLGFMPFFLFMDRMGLLTDDRMLETKKILEGHRQDNLTLAVVRVATDRDEVVWRLSARAGGKEVLNSMQVITSSVAAAVGTAVLQGRVPGRGLYFMEDLAAERGLFRDVLAQVRVWGVKARRHHKRKA